MSENSPNRRTFMSGLGVGLVGVACKSERKEGPSGPSTSAPTDPRGKADASRSLEQALATVLVLLGPWRPSEKVRADAFVERFLRRDDLMATLRPHASALVSLAKSLAPTGGLAPLGRVPLSELGAAEDEALHQVLVSLYSIHEVRFHAAGEPAAGVCMPDLSFLREVPS